MIARQLLCLGAESTIKVGRSKSSGFQSPDSSVPAWPEDGPVKIDRLQKGKMLAETCAKERGLPEKQRGLFVGISGIFYAAKAAGCDGKILQRDKFLEKLQIKIDEYLADKGKEGRNLANLQLVQAVVSHV